MPLQDRAGHRMEIIVGGRGGTQARLDRHRAVTTI
jgi:hypothetical protein